MKQNIEELELLQSQLKHVIKTLKEAKKKSAKALEAATNWNDYTSRRRETLRCATNLAFEEYQRQADKLHCMIVNAELAEAFEVKHYDTRIIKRNQGMWKEEYQPAIPDKIKADKSRNLGV